MWSFAWIYYMHAQQTTIPSRCEAQPDKYVDLRSRWVHSQPEQRGWNTQGRGKSPKNKIHPSPWNTSLLWKAARQSDEAAHRNNSSFISRSLWHCHALHTSFTPFPGSRQREEMLPTSGLHFDFLHERWKAANSSGPVLIILSLFLMQ